MVGLEGEKHMMTAEMRELIVRCVEQRSAHLIDLVTRGSDHKSVIEVFIDASQGVTAGLCSDVSRDIAETLKQSHLAPRDYTLTVSSPGIERPLRFPWQYFKHVGRGLRLTIDTGVGAQVVTGKCIAADAESVTLEVSGRQEPMQVAFGAIREAKVTVPW